MNKNFFETNFFYPKFKRNKLLFLDYILNNKNSLTTNLMGFDTIKINLVLLKAVFKVYLQVVLEAFLMLSLILELS